MEELKDLLYDVSVVDVMATTRFAVIQADNKLFFGGFGYNENNVFFLDFGFMVEPSDDGEGFIMKPIMNFGLSLTDTPHKTTFKGRIMEPLMFAALMLKLKKSSKVQNPLFASFAMN